MKSKEATRTRCPCHIPAAGTIVNCSFSFTCKYQELFLNQYSISPLSVKANLRTKSQCNLSRNISIARALFSQLVENRNSATKSNFVKNPAQQTPSSICMCIANMRAARFAWCKPHARSCCDVSFVSCYLLVGVVLPTASMQVITLAVLLSREWSSLMLMCV